MLVGNEVNHGKFQYRAAGAIACADLGVIIAQSILLNQILFEIGKMTAYIS